MTNPFVGAHSMAQSLRETLKDAYHVGISRAEDYTVSDELDKGTHVIMEP